MLLTPAPLRSTVSEEPDGLRIRIPAPRNLFLAIFFVFWLALWGSGLVSVARDGFNHKGKDIRTGLWLCFAVTITAFIVYHWLWDLLGNDIVVVRAGEIVLRRQILGLGFTRTFSSALVFNLRFVPEIGSRRSRSASRISFDYGAKTVSFARGIEEAEANHLIRLTRQRTSISDLPMYSDYSDPEKPSHTWLKLS